MTHREPWRVSTKNGLDSAIEFLVGTVLLYCDRTPAPLQFHNPRVSIVRFNLPRGGQQPAKYGMN